MYYTDPSGHSCDKDATQRQPEGSGSFADQLAQHVADEIAFNQEHGLTTQYDTPQAEAANRHVEQDSQTDTSANRPSDLEAAEPNNNNRQGREIVNIDTGTANAFISQDSPIRHELKDYVQGKNMVMTETAANEFRKIVNGAGGVLEQSRAERFLERVTIIPDNPSARAMDLQVTRKVGTNDIIIFGTGDNLNAVTMTADAKFVRGASAQGVDFDVYVHQPVPLQGK